MERNIVVTTKAKDGFVKTFGDYGCFLADYRFWLSGGRRSDDEEDFDKITDMLFDIDSDGSKFTIVRSGLEITFTLAIKW